MHRAEGSLRKMNSIESIVYDSFVGGKVSGIREMAKPEVLKTQISYLFFYPDSVYKYYLHSNVFFNSNFRDLDSPKSREYFYKRDFFWNNYFNKDVYLELKSLKIVDGKVAVSDLATVSEDYLIKMKRIDASSNLSHLLHEKQVGAADAFNIGYQMTKMIAEFPKKVSSAESYYSVTKRDIADLKNWMYSAKSKISKEQADGVIKALDDYVEVNRNIFEQFPADKYTISIDNHSDNIYYNDEKISFIDIYPPKEAWVFSHPIKNLYRPATDILILGGKELFEAMFSGYEKYSGQADRRHESFYLVYSACIQCVSLYNLSGNSKQKGIDAEKYWKFIEEKIAGLVKLS